MIDRELLELAAKAAGYKPIRMTDDGTALLAVMMGVWSTNSSTV